MRLLAAVIALAGAGALVYALVTIAAQQSTGVQPWGNELSDNIFFARTIPFVIGAGVAFGLFGAATAMRARIAKPGQARRFSRATVLGHLLITIGFLLALPTGVWQYLGGIIDVNAPIALYLIYRVHYIGAAIILFSVAYFLTYWWQTGNRALVPPMRDWRRYWSAFAGELPPAIGRLAARLMRVQPVKPDAQPGQFTYYETAFSFPTWSLAIGLITVTGLIKALRYLAPVPGPILFGASTLHVAAMVLLVVKTLDHLRYTFARWPLVVAMTTTWLSAQYARTHFPAWRRPADESEAA